MALLLAVLRTWQQRRSGRRALLQLDDRQLKDIGLSREAAESVRFEGKIFRRDIGWREAARLEERSAATTR